MSTPTQPRRSPAVDYELLDDESVLYDRVSHTVHHLNVAATAIWQWCDGRSVEDVVAAVASEFNVPPDAIQAEVVSTVARLEELGLLDETAGNGERGASAPGRPAREREP
jgi:PqqD family protein of HPr-rel-A system